MPKVLLLNGTNLNLLGSREPEIYGSSTLKEIEEKVAAVLSGHEIECETFQSNSEGEIIDWLHKHRGADFLLLIREHSLTLVLGCVMQCLALKSLLLQFTFPTCINEKNSGTTPIFQI